MIGLFKRIADRTVIKCNKLYDNPNEPAVNLCQWGSGCTGNISVTNNWIWNNASSGSGGQYEQVNLGQAGGSGSTLSPNTYSAPGAGQWESCVP